MAQAGQTQSQAQTIHSLTASCEPQIDPAGVPRLFVIICPRSATEEIEWAWIFQVWVWGDWMLLGRGNPAWQPGGEDSFLQLDFVTVQLDFVHLQQNR